MIKKEATDSTKNSYPVYLTINASNNPALVGYAIKEAISEAQEYGSILYVTVNAGNPTDPPKCPPGMNCHD